MIVTDLPDDCLDSFGFTYAWHIVSETGVLSQCRYVYQRRKIPKDGWHLVRIDLSPVPRL